MASIKNILFLFAILVSSTVTLAQGPSNSSNSDESTSVAPHDGSSEEPPMPSSAPGRFDHFAFRIPKFEFDWSANAEFSSGPRQKRSADRRVINCNFARDGLFTCTGCHTVRRCYPFNKGTESTCSGYFQYCNNGQCSRNKGPLCADTTSTSSSSSTTESTSTTGSSSSSSTADSTSTTGSSSTTGASSTTDSSSSSSSTSTTASSTTGSSTT